MIKHILDFVDNVFGSKPKYTPKPEYKDGDTIVLDNGAVETVRILNEKEVELLSKAKIKESQSEAVKEVFKELNQMTEEEFDAELKKYMSFEEGQCHPEECDGECDGEGWCDIAVEYRTKTDHIKRKF